MVHMVNYFRQFIVRTSALVVKQYVKTVCRKYISGTARFTVENDLKYMTNYKELDILINYEKMLYIKPS